MTDEYVFFVPAEQIKMQSDWIWVAYPYDDWSFSEMNGWVNPEDDPATPTESLLLDEIERLRDRLAMNGISYE